MAASALAILFVEPRTVAASESRLPAVATSALQRAISSGERVEDVSQRSEVSQVFANPDGTWTAEVASEPERTRDESGVWHDLDPTLHTFEGRLAPRHSLADLTLSAGGDRVVATMTVDGHELKWRWPTLLPAPTVEGETATYPDAVAEGGDLIVTATSTGFSHLVVLETLPTGPVEIRMPIAVDGGELTTAANGSVQIENPQGDAIVTAAPPVMWDAAENSAGDPVNVEPVETTVGENSAGTPTLTLSPDEQFLTDPDTVYPVTIDPAYTPYTTGDNWLDNSNNTYPTNEELKVGTYNGGAYKARSYLRFTQLPYAGAHVESAALVLRNWYSTTCTSAPIQVRKILEDWGHGTLTWGAQPTTTTTNSSTYSPAKGGGSGCAAGDATWNVTSYAQSWADGVANFGLRLSAVDETSNASWRKYRSANYSDQVVRPHLNITYTRPTVAVSPCVQPCDPDWELTNDLTPLLSAAWSAGGSSQVTYAFEIRAEETVAVLANGSRSASQGTPVSWEVPTGVLMNMGGYEYRVTADDGSRNADSGWRPLGVDIEEAPQVETESLTVAPCADLCESLVATSEEVVLSAVVTDPDTSGITPTFEIRAAGSTQVLASATGELVLQGTEAEFPITADLLADGNSYEFRLGATDGTSTTWSGWRNFDVQVPAGPEAPQGFDVSPCVAPCDRLVTGSDTPTISATRPGTATTGIDMKFEILDAGEYLVATHTVPDVVGDETASWVVPADLLNTGSYTVRVGSSSSGGINWSASYAVGVSPVTLDYGDAFPEYREADPNPDPQPGDDTVHDPDPALDAEDTGPAESEAEALARTSGTTDIRVRYAPHLQFRHTEDHFPLSATTFLNHSDLRWSHAECKDHEIDATVEGDRMDGGPNDGTYRHRQRGRLLCGHGDATSDLFYADSRDLRPQRRGGPGPWTRDQWNGTVEGMFLDFDNDHRDGWGLNHEEPVYVEYVPGRLLNYWFLYANSYNPAVGPDFTHEGDWEHIAIRLNAWNEPQEVEYFYHYESCTLPWPKVPLTGSHPRVWVASEAHGSYPPAADTVLGDNIANNGQLWNTSYNVRDVKSQTWWGYNGGWGQVGNLEVTTGPRGPSPQRSSEDGPEFGAANCNESDGTTYPTLR